MVLGQGWRNDSRGGGDYSLGALEEKGPQVSQRAQNHLYNYCNCSKTVKRSQKDPFSLYIGSPLVPPRKLNLWGPEGKVPPDPPGFSGHGEVQTEECADENDVKRKNDEMEMI